MLSVLYIQFTKFAEIEEDAPSYHRRYDFFVSIFCMMCHIQHEDVTSRTRHDSLSVIL